MLRAVLSAASLPERAERVAISIDDRVFGPLLIVTRDGHFVTCLGRGMRAGEHPVVTRTELDSLSRKIGRLREKMALENQLRVDGERGTVRLIRRLVVASESVSREDFLAVAAWEPLLGPTFGWPGIPARGCCKSFSARVELPARPRRAMGESRAAGCVRRITMNMASRLLVLLALVGIGTLAGCEKKKEASGSPPTQASVDANCAFTCADLLEGCPQPTRTATQTACVNTCKADLGKAYDKVRACSTKVASATGAKRCTAVNDCVTAK